MDGYGVAPNRYWILKNGRAFRFTIVNMEHATALKHVPHADLIERLMGRIHIDVSEVRLFSDRTAEGRQVQKNWNMLRNLTIDNE